MTKGRAGPSLSVIYSCLTASRAVALTAHYLQIVLSGLLSTEPKRALLSSTRPILGLTTRLRVSQGGNMVKEGGGGEGAGVKVTSISKNVIIP